MLCTAPLTLIVSVKVAIGCGVHLPSTQARSAALTPNASAGRGGSVKSLRLRAASIASCTAALVRSTTGLAVFAARSASRNTIAAIALRICSATPVITMPP